MGGRFARDYGLWNGQIPVDLSVLHDRFVPEYTDLRPYKVVGMAMFPQEGPVTRTRFAKVLIEQRLDEWERRWVYAHELGHYACGHLASPVTSRVDPGLYEIDEEDASVAAAAMLIPSHHLSLDATIEEVAADFDVSVEVAALFREALRRSFF